MNNLPFALANLLIALAVAGAIVTAALFLRPVVASRNEPLGFAWALALAAGALGYLNLLFLAVGLARSRPATGLPFPWWTLSMLLLIGGSGAIFFALRCPADDSPERPRFCWHCLPAAGLIALMFGANVCLAFAPYFTSDALLYHLTVPHLWLEGGLRALPEIKPSGYPLLVEMLYLIPVSEALPYGARVLHAAFGLGVAAFIYGFLRDRLTPAGALAFASAFFVFESVNEVAAWANSDVGRTFFLTGAAASLARYAESERRRDLALGAVMAGLALATHYMCLLFGNVLISLALGVVLLRSGAGPRRIARDLALFWLLSGAVLAPWLIKDLAHYGQPFFGLEGRNFRIPSEREIPFFLANVFFLGFGMASVGVLLRQGSARAEQILALYLLGYLAVGPFEMPPIHRFFFPIYSAGLMLAGRLAGPVFARRRWLEVALAAVLLVGALQMTYNHWRNFVFYAPTKFLFDNTPPHRTITWHH